MTLVEAGYFPSPKKSYRKRRDITVNYKHHYKYHPNRTQGMQTICATEVKCLSSFIGETRK